MTRALAPAGADLALCHIETPLSADDRDITGYPVFNTPHELADAVAWAGYDDLSTSDTRNGCPLRRPWSSTRATQASL